MTKNVKRHAERRKAGATPLAEYAGKWVAWDRSRSQIVASGDSLAEADAMAIAAGHQDYILQKVPSRDAVFIGGT